MVRLLDSCLPISYRTNDEHASGGMSHESHGEFLKDRLRRIAALPVGPGEGPLTEARAGAHSGDGNYLYVVCDL
jgi:hypothetical protein